MSVTIKGIKNLDANDYERMVIRRNGEDYQVIIKGKAKYRKLTNSSRISDDLKGKTDDEKLQMLVEYFLDYSIINFLMDKETYPYYSGKFSTARGSRQLDLQIGNKSQTNIPELVLRKYINDRLNLVNDMKFISNYEISTNLTHSSYEIKDDDIEPCIRFNLIGKEGRLYNFERNFIRNFIGDILESSSEEAKVEKERQYTPGSMMYFEGDTYFTCGDVSVKLSRNAEIISEVRNMVQKHNLIIYKAKEKQLKLEGI